MIEKTSAVDLNEIKQVAKLSLCECVEAPRQEKERLLPHIWSDIEECINSSNAIFLKYSTDQILGFILIKDGWNLSQLFVHPEQQGKGVGKALLISGIEQVLAEGKSAELKLNSSLNARGFYLAMGFDVDATRKPKSETSIPMRRLL